MVRNLAVNGKQRLYTCGISVRRHQRIKGRETAMKGKAFRPLPLLGRMNHLRKFLGVSVADNRDNASCANGHQFKCNGIVATEDLETLGG